MCSLEKRKSGPVELPLPKWLLFSKPFQGALLLGTKPAKCWLEAHSAVLPECTHSSFSEANDSVNMGRLLQGKIIFSVLIKIIGEI